ncbi:hypothetical protein P1J78_16335 [Psychromarinibacter sp. C21-152]|uniref:Uncharacterized protein n=1 Tax=Psychromarinibacter sediminicola TaxID=3033385 RepID=A0AAE3NVA5_9RHOB|nr:hypothetical protein [Psychromarinibacter sediminicola]
MSSQELRNTLEALRSAQDPLIEGMPHPSVRRKEYLNALAQAYEAGMLVPAQE